MIVDVDRALLSLLRREILGEAPIEVVFEVPNRAWTQAVKRPTVDMFLYDVRENVQHREVMPEAIRDDKGLVVGHRPPARRFDLFYVLSVWGVPLAAEHQLVSAILGGLSEHAVFPREHLSDGLKSTEHQIFLSVADGMKRGMLPSFGGEMKLQLEVAVTACMPSKTVDAVGIPVRTGVELRTKAPGVAETVTVAPGRKGMVEILAEPPKDPAQVPAKEPAKGSAKESANPAPATAKPEPDAAKPPAGPTTQAQAEAMTAEAKAKAQQQVQQAATAKPDVPPAAKPPNADPVAKLAAALTQAAQVQAALAQTMAQCVAALTGASAGAPQQQKPAQAPAGAGQPAAKKAAAPPKGAPPSK